MSARARMLVALFGAVLGAGLAWYKLGAGTLPYVIGSAGFAFMASREYVAHLRDRLHQAEQEPDGRLVVRFGDQRFLDVDTRHLFYQAMQSGGVVDLSGGETPSGERIALDVRDGEGRPVRFSFEVPEYVRAEDGEAA